MKILIIGDIVGKVGVDYTIKKLATIKKEYSIDFTIANGENSADGMGITKAISDSLYYAGVNIITMGNHTWGKKDIFSFIDDEERLVRPANYADGIVGRGSTVMSCKGLKIGVINLIGRVNMGGSYDSPFKSADVEIEKLKSYGTDIVIVDFHAEATAEKIALAYYLKEKVTFLYGTHTHVQTADEKIFDTGMGYITDVGMTGPVDSVIGMDISAALKRFLTQMPERYACAQGEAMLNGVVIEVDEQSHVVTDIERINQKN